MNFLSKLSLRNSILLVNAILLCAVAAIIFLVIIPSTEEISKMKQNIMKERIDLEQKYEKGLSLKKLSENLKTIEPRMLALNQTFISANRELEFITALEGIAAKNGVSQKISLGKPAATGDKPYKKTPLNIQIQGSYRNAASYLRDLERSNYYINIKSIEMASAGYVQPNSINDGGGGVGATILAETYWR